MKIKLLAVIVTLLAAGVAFSVSPLASAEEGSGSLPEIVETESVGGAVYLRWSHDDFEEGSAYVLSRGRVGQLSVAIAELPNGVSEYVDYPGDGTFYYSISVQTSTGSYSNGLLETIENSTSGASGEPPRAENESIIRGPKITSIVQRGNKIELEYSDVGAGGSDIEFYVISRSSGSGPFQTETPEGDLSGSYSTYASVGTTTFRVHAYRTIDGVVQPILGGPDRSITVTSLEDMPADGPEDGAATDLGNKPVDEPEDSAATGREDPPTEDASTEDSDEKAPILIEPILFEEDRMLIGIGQTLDNKQMDVFYNDEYVITVNLETNSPNLTVPIRDQPYTVHVFAYTRDEGGLSISPKSNVVTIAPAA